MKNKLLFKVILLVVAIFILWMSRESISALWSWISDRETVTTSMEQMGIWAPLVLCILFILQVFLAFIPGQALMVASSYLYGFWGGFMLSWLSLVIGGEAAFLLARHYGRSFAEQWISPNVLARWDKSSEGQGVGFFTLSLVMPLVPNDAMCYVAGLGKISQRRFSVANFLGRGIACLVMSWIGAFGPHAPAYVWFILITMAICLVGWGIYKKAGNSPRIKKDLANAAGMSIAKTYKNLFRLKYEVKGFESLPPGPKIIAINHTNVTDAIFLPLIFSEMPRLIVQDDLFQVPVVGNILKETGQIPVDPEDRHKAFEQAYESLLQAKRY